MVHAGVADTTPEGFRRHASGLIVPAAQSRVREVWPRDESRLLDRAMRLLADHGLKLRLACTEPGCQDAPLTRLRDDDGAIVLQCAHKSRVFTTAF